MKSLTPEMIEKAKAAKSAEELLEIAKANGVEMTADEATTYFAQLNPKSGELDDDDLDNVSGGACERTEQARDAKEAIKGMVCGNCGKGPSWHLYTKRKDKTTFYCNICKKYAYLLAEEDNSILHMGNGTWYPDTP